MEGTDRETGYQRGAGWRCLAAQSLCFSEPVRRPPLPDFSEGHNVVTFQIIKDFSSRVARIPDRTQGNHLR